MFFLICCFVIDGDRWDFLLMRSAITKETVSLLF